MYRVTKTYGHDLGLSCCFRQWKATSHCNLLHGYAISVRIVFQCDTLDERNWVVDFGGLGVVKNFLFQTFDHSLIVAADDPKLDCLLRLQEEGLAKVFIIQRVGCESFAEFICRMVQAFVAEVRSGVSVVEVEVREHGANAASYLPEVHNG